MSPVSVREHADGVTIETAGWTLEHSRALGGAWSSLRASNHKDSANLLAAPFSSALAVLKANYGEPAAYLERFEANPVFRVEQSGAVITVVAEGAYRSQDGGSVPVGYRRRTEYHPHGMIWTTLEIMSDVGCPGVQELHVATLSFARRFERLFARFHPTQAGTPELFGARGWYDLGAEDVDFQTRFTPLQLTLSMEKDERDRLEFLLPSDLMAWDYGLRSDCGLGLYNVMDGRHVTLAPYSVLNCEPAVVRGRLYFRLGLTLPDRSRAVKSIPKAPRVLPATSTVDEAIKAAVNAETLVIDAPFAGDPALPKLLDAARKNGAKKVFAGFSLNELSVADACFPRVAEWMHQASPMLSPVARKARGDGSPAGAMLCLKSGWFDELKKRIEAAWLAAAWDGLYLLDASFHPCRHPRHSDGPFHSDAESYIALLTFCRELVGAKTLLIDPGEQGAETILAGNMAEVVGRKES